MVLSYRSKQNELLPRNESFSLNIMINFYLHLFGIRQSRISSCYIRPNTAFDIRLGTDNDTRPYTGYETLINCYNYIGFKWNSICYYLEVVCKPWHLVTFTSPSSEPHGWCTPSATFGRQPPSSWNCLSHWQYEYPSVARHFWQSQDSYETTRQCVALGIWFYIIICI